MRIKYINNSMGLMGLMGLMFFSGCTSTRTFNSLKDDYANEKYSDYYYEEVSRVDAILPQPNDDFLKTVDARLADFQEKWKKLQEEKQADFISTIKGRLSNFCDEISSEVDACIFRVDKIK